MDQGFASPSAAPVEEAIERLLLAGQGRCEARCAASLFLS